MIWLTVRPNLLLNGLTKTLKPSQVMVVPPLFSNFIMLTYWSFFKQLLIFILIWTISICVRIKKAIKRSRSFRRRMSRSELRLNTARWIIIMHASKLSITLRLTWYIIWILPKSKTWISMIIIMWIIRLTNKKLFRVWWELFVSFKSTHIRSIYARMK